MSTAGLLRRGGVAALNEVWFRKAPTEQHGAIHTISSFFHPLDGVRKWNRIYGRPGFLQYQYAVPVGQQDMVRDSLRRLSDAHCPAFLAILKRFGAQPGYLSFPPGCTLALDVPTTTPGLAALLDGLGRAGGSRRGASTSPIPGCAQRCRPRCTTVSGSGGPSATGATPSGCCTPICPAAWASSTAASPRSGTLPRPATKGKGQRERRSRLGAVCPSPRRRQRHRAGNRPPTGSRPHRDSGTCRPLPRAAERRRRGAVGCRGQHRRSRA